MTARQLSLQVVPILYRSSFVILVLVFGGLLVVTPIDTILQSQRSGQFWNVIIIVVAHVLTVLAVAILYTIRLVISRRSLADIPRRYIPRPEDISIESAKIIQSELSRCEDIVQKTLPMEKISHPGLMNPTLSNGNVNAPYEDVIETVNSFLELKSKTLHSSFGRPIGMPVREYVLLLLSYGAIDSPETVNKFITLYERLRFSGKPIQEKDFNDYMECSFKLLLNIKMPDGADEIRTPSVEQVDPLQVLSRSTSRSGPQSHPVIQLINPFTNRSRTDSINQSAANQLFQPQSYNNLMVQRGSVSDAQGSLLQRYPSTALSPFQTVSQQQANSLSPAYLASMNLSTHTVLHHSPLQNDNVLQIPRLSYESNNSQYSVPSDGGSVLIRRK